MYLEEVNDTRLRDRHGRTARRIEQISMQKRYYVHDLRGKTLCQFQPYENYTEIGIC